MLSQDMKRFAELLKKIPPVGWAMTVFLYGFECLMYLLGPELSMRTGTDSWAIAPKIPFIDDNIPEFRGEGREYIEKLINVGE